MRKSESSVRTSAALWISESRTRQASTNDLGRLRSTSSARWRHGDGAAHKRRQIRLLLLYSESDKNHSPPEEFRVQRASRSRPSGLRRKAALVSTASHVSSGGAQALLDRPPVRASARIEKTDQRTRVDEAEDFPSLAKSLQIFRTISKIGGRPLSAPARSLAKS